MARTDVNQSFGLGEAHLRRRLEEELELAMKTEGGLPTVHAFAHSIARIIAEDHQAMSGQLSGAGVELRR